jgi:hypothetical protein
LDKSKKIYISRTNSNNRYRIDDKNWNTYGYIEINEMPIKYDIDTTDQKEVIWKCILGDGDIEELIQHGKIYYSSFVDLINYTKNAKFWANFLERKVSIKTCVNILAEKDIRENVLFDILDYLSIDRISEVFNAEKFSLERIEKYLKERVSADRAQAILYKMVEKTYFKRLAEILTYSANDVTLTANATFSYVNRFRDLNLNGYTYTADGELHVIIARDIYIPSNSSIVRTNFVTNYAAILLLDTNQIPTGGKGGNGGITYLRPYPEGGGGGGGGINGPGGYGYMNGEVGYGYSAYVYTNTIAIAYVMYLPAVDWYLVNVLQKTPTSKTDFIKTRGACGGQGGSGLDGIGSPRGFSTWGLVILCRNLYCSGKIQANGTNGRDGGKGTYGGGGGAGGGSGGPIYIVLHEIQNSGEIQAIGGNGGRGGDATAVTGASGGGGGGGCGGVIYLFYKTGNVGNLNVSGGAGGPQGDGATYGDPGSPGQRGIARPYKY